MAIRNFKKTFIIAEIGNNHEGSLSRAKQLILAARKCGVDAVKFQTYIPNLIVSPFETERFKKLKKFQLSLESFKKLAVFAKKNKILFFSTPLDLKSAIYLNKIQKIFKIASSDSNFFPLIRKISNFNKTILLSTGMTSLKEIIKSKNMIFKIWKKKKIKSKKLVIMHCVSSYPVIDKEANLLAINALKKNFKDCVIGYSDHTLGNTSCLAAVALGAKVIEKHFTLNKNFSNFRDHKLSANPKEMRELVINVRRLEILLGNGKKVLQKSEIKNLNYMRRGMVSLKDLPAGAKLKNDDFKWIRVKNDIKINKEKKFINKKLLKNIKKEQIFFKKFFS
jgi:N,N'-diacetyllegionaminate synthase